MSTNLLQDLLLLQFADSSLPIGSFAYSSGLEAILEFGLVQTELELENYIFDFLKQSIAFDFPFLNSVYSICDDTSLNEELFVKYDSSFCTASMYESSLNLGKNWLRVIEEILCRIDIADKVKIILKDCAYHYLLVLGITFKMLNINRQKMFLYHINSLARDQVGCAIRIGGIGAMQGNKMLHTLHQRIHLYIQDQNIEGAHRAVKVGFITDVGQMLHKSVYSKLFRN